MSDDTTEFSELAQVILSEYLPVADTHTDYLHLAIMEFEDYRRKGIPYTYGDRVISIEEFLSTIDSILRYRLDSGESA
jgi:hypothetical protein